METRFDKRMNEIPLPAEQKEKIIEEYKDLVGDKPLSEEVQQKRFKAAYYTIVGEKYDSEEKIIKSQASLGTGNTSKGTKSKVLQDNTQYLRDCGYLKD
ncbi:MAG: hypothetical protein LBU27_06910 [Candidatus Peribacteria bacterium]|jgi:hypothetical protein|nr:hypothetical protein [Candidatus Peribacteria bacterium]